jgi:hypothetical protein
LVFELGVPGVMRRGTLSARSVGAVKLVLVGAIVAWTVVGCGGGGGGGGGVVDRGRVIGTVLVNAAGGGTEPLANATVSAGGIIGKTGTDGAFILDSVPVNTPTGVVTAAGYTAKTFAITLTRAGEVYNAGTLVMVVDPNTGTVATVTGIVRVQETGSLVSGAKVAMGDNFQYAAFTNSSGRFTITGVPISLRRLKVIGNKVEGGYHDAYVKLTYALVAGTNDVGTVYVTSYANPPPPPPFDW